VKEDVYPGMIKIKSDEGDIRLIEVKVDTRTKGEEELSEKEKKELKEKKKGKVKEGEGGADISEGEGAGLPSKKRHEADERRSPRQIIAELKKELSLARYRFIHESIKQPKTIKPPKD